MLALSVVCALLLVIYICTVFYLCMRKVQKIFEYSVTRPFAGFRHPDRMATEDQTVRGGEILSLAHAGILHSSMSLPHAGILYSSISLAHAGILYSSISLAHAGILHSSMLEGISGMEKCKIPAWARDKIFRHEQGAFSFPELNFSIGKLYFD